MAVPSIPLVQEVMPLLQTRQIGRVMQGYDSVASTNTLAALWANEGAAEGSVVVTEFQTAGRGRHGRIWEATSGQNLMFSVILRPRLRAEQLGLITLAGGIAVAEAVDVFISPLSPTIKWPNDILLNDRKCCGMLLESTLHSRKTTSPTVILGIGLNVNQDAFPPELEARATSLLLETGRPLPRAALFAEILLRLEHQVTLLDHGDTPAILNTYATRLYGIDEEVTLQMTRDGQSIQGVLTGITETGALCLLTADGPRTFHAGDVTMGRLGIEKR